MDRSLFHKEVLWFQPMSVFVIRAKENRAIYHQDRNALRNGMSGFFNKMPSVKLFILAGSYAVRYYLPEFQKQTLVETIKLFMENADSKFIPLVHPSPRNRLWLRKNPWFEKSYIPWVRKRIVIS